MKRFLGRAAVLVTLAFVLVAGFGDRALAQGGFGGPPGGFGGGFGQGNFAQNNDEVVRGLMDQGYKIVPRNGIALDAFDDRNIPATISTAFLFHEPDLKTETLIKNFNTGQLPDGVRRTHTYSLQEIHGTTGSSDHFLEIKYLTIQNPKPGQNPIEVPFLRDSLQARIVPGKAEPPNAVTILAGMADPIPLSDTSPDAAFGFSDEGLDLAFSLGQLTQFPDQFAQNDGEFGAIADDTSMRFRVRVAPGVISEPEDFWDENLSGAIDIVSLTLQSDALFNVNATFVTGASTSDFTLDLAGLAGAEAAIEAAFAGNQGTLLANLEDVFTVGFTPQPGVSEYTIGFARDYNIAAWEPAPEPSSLALLAVGGLLLAALRSRRAGRDALARP